MASTLVLIRDAVYDAINAKAQASGFTYANDFILKKTWRPWTALEDLADPAQYPHGQVYVIGRNLGDQSTIARDNSAMGEFPIQVGFQKVVTDLDDVAEIDGYADFVQELADTVRLEVDDILVAAFSRHEFLKDPDGNLMSFIMLRQATTFEAYFTSVFSLPIPGNSYS